MLTRIKAREKVTTKVKTKGRVLTREDRVIQLKM